MFRRRTDQVYATLQQVQRRITEQGPNTAQPSDRSATVQPLSPLQEALQRQKSPPQLVGMQPEPAPPPAQFGQLSMPKGGGIVLPLTVPFALTLTVLWIVSCVTCFVLGQHERDRRAPSPGEGYAAGASGNRDAPSMPEAAPAAKPTGPDLLVLTQVPTATPEMEQSYRQRAAKLNTIMDENASRGWKPWFGVRRPINGGLQLIFGQVAEGQFGVNRKDFDDFARMLAQPPPKGGGYASAIWVKAN